MSEIENYLKKEEHGIVSAHALVEIGTLDSHPLLVAPKGGVTTGQMSGRLLYPLHRWRRCRSRSTRR